MRCTDGRVRRQVINAQEIASEAAKALENKLAKDIRIWDVRGVSTVTDYYIVATGTSGPHLKALISETQRHMKDLGVSSYRSSGTSDSGWVVLDFVHAVIHIFSAEARDYYAIETLWKDAKQVRTGHAG